MRRDTADGLVRLLRRLVKGRGVDGEGFPSMGVMRVILRGRRVDVRIVGSTTRRPRDGTSLRRGLADTCKREY